MLKLLLRIAWLLFPRSSRELERSIAYHPASYHARKRRLRAVASTNGHDIKNGEDLSGARAAKMTARRSAPWA